MPTKTPAADKIMERYEKNKEKYNEEGKDIQKDALSLEDRTKVLEERALKYDFGEGLLEIGLILTSLYFISKSKMFPTVGLIASIGGIAMALMGFLM
jgi:hypothetical protein